MYRVKRKRIKTKDRTMHAGDTFEVAELGLKPGPKLDRLLDRLTRLDMVIEVEGNKKAPASVVNVGTVVVDSGPEPTPENLPEEFQPQQKAGLTLGDLEHKGPWYYLPNGEKVKGKKAALEALVSLNGGN